MKKVYISITTLLLCANLLFAQTPAHRSTQTITADLLAQMPADTQAEYNKLIGELCATGEAGVLMLVDRMHAPAKESNAQVEYALSGLTHFVIKQGDEQARLAVSNAYVKALDSVEERETKAFIIRQLQICGRDECVEALARYLNREDLSAPAATALAAIQTENAGKALQASLLRRMGTPQTQRDAIVAIGQAQVATAEALLLTMIGQGDANTQKDLLYALGRIGSKASLQAMAAAAEQTGFTMEQTGANEAYIMLLKRLATQGETKEADKAATGLLKKATKANQTHTRNAALQVVLSIRKEQGMKLVLAVLKDPSKEHRNAALDYTSAFANKEVYAELLKTMDKAKPEAKVDILHWIGRESKCPNKHEIIKNLDVRFDLTAQQLIVSQLKSPHFAVKQAAVWALVKIAGAGVIPSLAALLSSPDKQTVLLAQDALAAFQGNVAPAVAKAIPQSGDAGKIAGVELLAMRKASANLNTVLELIKSASPEVKAAAYAALKDVVSDNDFTLLCGMLETADGTAIAPLQQAVIASVAAQPKADQLTTLSKRMLQAGESKKHLYYVALAATAEQEALATITTGFEKGNGAAKEAAFDALQSWKGIEAAESLFAVCQDASATHYFDRALTTYVKLVSNPSLTPENRLLSLRKAMEVAKTDAQKILILRQIERTGTYPALLYAGGFIHQKPLQQAAANAVMTIALANKQYTGTAVKELLNSVSAVLDSPDGGYQRQALKKHLDEMPSGEGFVSLFNGTDLTGWKGLVENPIARAKMKPAQLAKAQEKADQQMHRDWKVENGLLLFDGTGYDNLCTEKQYADFELYVDWMLDPAGPEADAGIYLRGTPQVQMWDIARTNAGAQVGSGGLYNNQTHESKPLQVSDNKLGEWNTMYIKMVGDRVTVVLNGQLVTNDVILENYWDRTLPIPAIEQIELQAHGSKVYYRNIYLKELERSEPFTLSAEETKEGFSLLFDGTNMHQWRGNTVDYTIEEGCISMNPSKSFGGNLYTKKEYANFVYRFEFQLTPGANNGLGIRTPMEGDAAYVGMELQILDSESPIYKELKAYQYHGSVYGVIPAKRGFLKPMGEWNCQEVIAHGDQIKITLNGEVILDGNIREASKNGTADGQQHPGLLNKKGHIAYLGHGSPVKFRNIRIKELK